MKTAKKEAAVTAPGKPFLMRVGIGLFGIGMLAGAIGAGIAASRFLDV